MKSDPHTPAAYRDALADAQDNANHTGLDYGLERTPYGYRTFMLPQRQHRAGHELRCEVVSCEIWDKIQVGHGPLGRVANGWHGGGR